MAENTGSAQGAVVNFVDKVCVILPAITPDLLKKLLEYLESVGVSSEADIDKVNEHELASVLGHDNARKLLDYFKKEEPVITAAPPTPSVMNSPLPVAMPQMMAIGSNYGDGRGNTLEILQMVMAMQRMDGDKNREMLMAMQQSQDKTLGAVTKAMSEMSEMHKGTLATMSEQMTKQSEMHQETIKVMNEQMKTTSKMHGETLQAVQQGMAETRKMNAETLTQVTQTMAATLEAQEKSMQEYRLSLARQNNNKCAVM